MVFTFINVKRIAAYCKVISAKKIKLRFKKEEKGPVLPLGDRTLFLPGAGARTIKKILSALSFDDYATFFVVRF
jgi:hypothetical protein